MDDPDRLLARARRCYERAQRAPMRSNERRKKTAESRRLLTLAFAEAAEQGVAPEQLAAQAGLELR